MHHQHGPHCSHGQHGHGHGHGHHNHPHMPHLGQQAAQESPEQYFANLKKRWNDQQGRVFFWQELLHGVVIDRFYERFGLDFMRSLSCQSIVMLIHGLQSLARFDCIPSRLQPIFAGLFFPILFLIFFNYNVVVGMTSSDELLKILAVITLFLYLLVALRGNSSLNTQQMKQKSKEIYEVRPYLQSPQLNCPACGVLRLFRAAHCPYCKSCIGKHSCHSVVFGCCIGAANELLYFLFFIGLNLTLGRILWLFWAANTYGLITKVMFYLLNFPLWWMSFTETLLIFTFNFWYGVTEQELKMWPMQQYLQKLPERTFQNNIGQGLTTNFINSCMALFGIKGVQSQPEWSYRQLTFPRVDSNRTYRINWDKAVIYIVPQIPHHKNRSQIIEMMQRDEPKMIEMFKLQTKIKAEVMEQPGANQLNQFQIQQKVAIKMQTHMARNMPQMMQPSAEQQRNIQLQMLSHMKRQFASEEDLHQQIVNLEEKLKEQSLTAIEANMQMRMLQQSLMTRRMMKMKQQVQEQQRSKLKEEEEATPMRNVADEDL